MLPDRLAVWRLDPGAEPPRLDELRSVGLWSITRTEHELSVIGPESAIAGHLPPTRVETGFRALEVIGPLDFSAVGIVAGLSAALSRAKIPVLVVSTFDTDYLLVREDRLDQAVDRLAAAGYAVEDS